MDKRVSNYEITKHMMQEKFASYDLSDICREWELTPTDSGAVLTLLARQYYVDRKSGAVLQEKDGILKEADHNVSMTLFDILTRRRQCASGEMVSVSSLSPMHLSNETSLFAPTAKTFEHRCSELAAACENLGGISYGKGDVCYLLPVFRDLSVAVSFWDSDDEFGPQLSFLCDRNILCFMHYETMMFLLCHVADRLKELIEAFRAE